MKGKYLCKSDPVKCLNGKVYDILGVEPGPDDTKWYRVIDEEGVYEGIEPPGYLYPVSCFELVE